MSVAVKSPALWLSVAQLIRPAPAALLAASLAVPVKAESPAAPAADAPALAAPVEPRESNETTANNPLSLVRAIQVQNYYQPVLNGTRSGGSNQPYLRAILPFDGFGGRNLMRISLPAGTMVWNQ